MKNKNVFFLKKYFLSQDWTGFHIKTTSFVCRPNFQWRFCFKCKKKETANICFDYLNDTCLKKTIANIQNLISDMVTWWKMEFRSNQNHPIRPNRSWPKIKIAMFPINLQIFSIWHKLHLNSTKKQIIFFWEQLNKWKDFQSSRRGKWLD